MSEEKRVFEHNGIIYHQASWQSDDVLKDLDSWQIQISEETKAAIHAALWRNITSEYDSVFLSKQIQANAKQLSPEVLTFERLWFPDEVNHYRGLLKIYSKIYDRNENEVDEEIKARIPDFSNFDFLFKDEFLFCINFAYVELVGTRGYAEVFPIYDSYAVPALSKWVRLAARDEMYHFLNMKNIIQKCYQKQIPKVPSILRKIVENEHVRSDEYKATFLFDHDPPTTSASSFFFKKCANDICRYLSTTLVFEGLARNEKGYLYK